MDVSSNVKVIRRQVEQNNVVGFIAAHKPDFEFANFTINELVKIAAQMDDENVQVLGDRVRNADWTNVHNGADFEKKYKEISAPKRSLKGEKWGRALANYAVEYPRQSDAQDERPFMQAIRVALTAWCCDYDLQKVQLRIDPQTFIGVDQQGKTQDT